MAKKPRPETITQTLTVGRPPSTSLLSRTVQRFAGPWMLSSYGWTVLPNGLYRLEVVWRSDVQQVASWWTANEQGTVSRVIGAKLYADIGRLDRLRLWLLVVESMLRCLLRRV